MLTDAGETALATSTIPALYAAAAEHATAETDLILLTDGVNHDELIDLNRPLAPGEGHTAAGPVRGTGDRQPSNDGRRAWPNRCEQPAAGLHVGSQEVRGSNATLCDKSGPRTCRLFTTATVTETLAVSSRRTANERPDRGLRGGQPGPRRGRPPRHVASRSTMTGSPRTAS